MRLSFVHIADAHLGYSQYGLEARRKDFSEAFEEVVEETVKLKPDFMLIAGDFFHDPRPTNPTLAEAVQSLKRLKDAGVKVFVVDGSHDSALNVATGTVLAPLDRAGLLCYLPTRPGACRQDERCYIYGMPNYVTRSRVKEHLPAFLNRNPPTPHEDKFNVLLFHGAVEDPVIKQYCVKTELLPEHLPDGFNYYAGGHVHVAHKTPFKSGLLVYSGCLEATAYDEAGLERGFYYVEVVDKEAEVQRVRLEPRREFIVMKRDFSGKSPEEIVAEAARLVEEADKPDAILVLVLKGLLPREARRTSINLMKIRSSAKSSLYLHIINRLEEVGIEEELRRVVFKKGVDLWTKARDYFFQLFAERYDRETAERYARLAVDLVAPLIEGRAEVKEMLEKALTKPKSLSAESS